MSIKPLIACFDIATSTGVCVGRPGEKHPLVWTWDLRRAGKSRPYRLLYLATLCVELFEAQQVDIVAYEAPMPLAVMHKIGANEETLLLLRGAIGIVEAEAARAKIETIKSFSVQDARKHFVGQRTFPKGKNGRSAAKDFVLIMCDTLGIKVTNDNEADAVAGWSYECALANPRIAHLGTPLFQHGA